jgi:cytochrome c556
MRSRPIVLLLIISMSLAAADACKSDNRERAAPAAVTASPERVPPGVTAVQNEMRLLLEAMRNTVTAIAMGTMETIPGSLESVHHARELTEKAVETGGYKLPKNGDKLAEFKELDEVFHSELEKLVAAAQSKNAQATATQLGVLLSKCDGCHTQYRR